MDPRVTELHCIMPIANIGSVLAHGILSYERAAKLAHHSVAMCRVPDHHIVPSRSPLLLAREVFRDLAGDGKPADREVCVC